MSMSEHDARNKVTLGSAILMGLLLGACQGPGEVAMTGEQGLQQPPKTPAIAPVARRVSAPFDLGRVMRRVNFAYRSIKDGEFSAGHATYAVRVREDGTISMNPFHHPRQGADREVIRGGAVHLTTVAVARGPLDLSSDRVSARVESDGSLSLSRGDLVERLTNSDQGVEQSWLFGDRPEGTGDLEVRVRVRGMVFAGRTAHGLHFKDPKTGLGIRYGWASWVDAMDKRWQLQSRFDEEVGAVVLSVPAAVLDSSAYPAVLDPVLMPEFDLNEPVYTQSLEQQQAPGVAFDGVDTYLVVWQDDRGGNWNIHGARVDSTGEMLDPLGFDISRAGGAQQYPVVDFDGSTFLVVWEDNRAGNWNIFGARVDAASWTVLDPAGIAISTAGNNQQRPDITFDGTDFMVVWQDQRNGNWDVYGTRVNAQGTVQDAAGIAIFTQTNNQQNPAVAFDGSNYLVVWQHSGADWNIYGTRLDTGLTVLDPNGIPISPAPNDQQNPEVAFGGDQFLVVWQDYRTGAGGSRWDIYGARVDDLGDVQEGFGIPISAYDQDEQDQTLPQVVYDGSEYFMVVWQDNRLGTTNNPKWDVYGARVDAAGVVEDTPSLIMAQQSGYQQRPALAWGDSQYMLVWQDSRWGSTSGTKYNIYGTLMDDSGSPDVADILITTDLNRQKLPAMAYDPVNDRYLVVWSEYTTGDYGPGWDLLYAQVEPDGSVLDNGVVSDGPATQQEANVVYGGGQFLVTWSDSRNSSSKGWDIYGARISSAGSLLDPDGVAFSSVNKDQRFPAAAFDGTNYFVVWQDARGTTTDIYGTRISKGGVVQDVGGIEVYTGGGTQSKPAVAFDGTTYLVVWEHSSAGAWDINGRRVDPDGSLLDAQGIPISYYTADQRYPAVTFDGANYVVVWQDNRSGGWDIYSTQVDPSDGEVLDINGVAVSTADKAQLYPLIDFDGVNTLVIWEDFRDNTLWAVYGARLTPELVVGDILGFAITEPGAVDIAAPALASNGNGAVLVAYERKDSTTPYGTMRVSGRIVVTRAPDGVGCEQDIDCISEFCVDDVCCDNACGDGDPTDCRACSSARGADSDGICGIVAADTICRPAAGLCDVADTCNGTSTTCPSDELRTAGFICRAAAGDCDVEELCDGLVSACPIDALKMAGEECRAAAGDCDLAESCTGLTTDCPEDLLESFGAVCRASEGECDPEETCDGIAPDCPTDELVADGEPCTNGTCADGVCVPDPDMGVPDAGGDMLAEAGTDALTDAVGQPDGQPADGGSTTDAGADAVTEADALLVEGGPKSFCFGPNCDSTGSGCSCHVSGGRAAPGGQPWILALALCLLVLRRRFRSIR